MDRTTPCEEGHRKGRGGSRERLDLSMTRLPGRHQNAERQRRKQLRQRTFYYVYTHTYTPFSLYHIVFYF